MEGPSGEGWSFGLSVSRMLMKEHVKIVMNSIAPLKDGRRNEVYGSVSARVDVSCDSALRVQGFAIR